VKPEQEKSREETALMVRLERLEPEEKQGMTPLPGETQATRARRALSVLKEGQVLMVRPEPRVTAGAAERRGRRGKLVLRLTELSESRESGVILATKDHKAPKERQSLEMKVRTARKAIKGPTGS